jgi:hypothetical protein
MLKCIDSSTVLLTYIVVQKKQYCNMHGVDTKKMFQGGFKYHEQVINILDIVEVKWRD